MVAMRGRFTRDALFLFSNQRSAWPGRTISDQQPWGVTREVESPGRKGRPENAGLLGDLLGETGDFWRSEHHREDSHQSHEIVFVVLVYSADVAGDRSRGETELERIIDDDPSE